MRVIFLCSSVKFGPKFSQMPSLGQTVLNFDQMHSIINANLKTVKKPNKWI